MEKEGVDEDEDDWEGRTGGTVCGGRVLREEGGGVRGKGIRLEEEEEEETVWWDLWGGVGLGWVGKWGGV